MSRAILLLPLWAFGGLLDGDIYHYLTCFEHHLLILRRHYTNNTLYIACLCLIQLPAFQSRCSQLTDPTHSISNAVCVAAPEDEQVMVETCKGP
jgi:hypothetical protein